MTTTPTVQPVATQQGPTESSTPARPDPLPRRPRSVTMPPAALIARFSPEAAEKITAWRECHGRAVSTLQAVDDADVGGTAYSAAIGATARSVRTALLAGQDPDEAAEVEALAAFLRDEHAIRTALAVVATVRADVMLDGLLADVTADTELRDRVDRELERWVAQWCRVVDSDQPGAVERAQQANDTEWRPMAGLLAWLGSPQLGYRLRPKDAADARLAESFAMSGLRNGRPVALLPYRGGFPDQGDNIEPSGRFDRDGRVLVEAPLPTPLALGPAPAPEPPPVESRARSRWWGVSA